MTDMTLGRWSHVPAFPIIVNGNRLSLCSPVSQNPINLKINLFVKKMWKNVKQKSNPKKKQIKMQKKAKKAKKQKKQKKSTKKNKKWKTEKKELD